MIYLVNSMAKIKPTEDQLITLHSVYEELLSLIVDADKGVILVVFLIQGFVEVSIVLDAGLEVLHRILLVDAHVVRTGNLHLLQLGSDRYLFSQC